MHVSQAGNPSTNTEVTAIKAVTDNLPDSGALTTIGTNVGSVLTDTGTTIPGTITTLQTGVTTIDGLVDQLIAERVSVMDFWSEVVEEVALTATATDTAITGGNVTVAIPANVTIERVVAMFMCRSIENTNAAANEIEATAQDIEVKENAAGSYTDAIDITQGAFAVAASTREMGTVMIGDIDVSGEVDANDTYAFQWKAAEATQANLNFNDVQMGLRVWFRC